mgnify:CR=1
MPSLVKTEAEQERQKLFEQLRHYFSSRHQVPCYLSNEKMQEWLNFIGEGE